MTEANRSLTQREIADTLRNPNGPYFADDTPAMLALETMVDTVGLRNVLWALSCIASAKATHIRENWQDKALERAWIKASNLIDDTARQVKAVS